MRVSVWEILIILRQIRPKDVLLLHHLLLGQDSVPLVDELLRAIRVLRREDVIRHYPVHLEGLDVGHVATEVGQTLLIFLVLHPQRAISLVNGGNVP